MSDDNSICGADHMRPKIEVRASSDKNMQPAKVAAKPRKKAISAALRRKVWDTHGGEGLRTIPCAANCGKDIDITAFECGHVVAESKGGATSVENLKPICGGCNKSMGTQNLDEFAEKMGYEADYCDEFMVIVDKLSAGADSINTPFDDGTCADYNCQYLATLRIASLTCAPPRGIPEAEIMADSATLRNLLHKYKVCHRDDFEYNDKSAHKRIIAHELLTTFGDGAVCKANCKDGSRCANPPKHGDYCGVHKPK